MRGEGKGEGRWGMGDGSSKDDFLKSVFEMMC